MSKFEHRFEVSATVDSDSPVADSYLLRKAILALSNQLDKVARMTDVDAIDELNHVITGVFHGEEKRD